MASPMLIRVGASVAALAIMGAAVLCFLSPFGPIAVQQRDFERADKTRVSGGIPCLSCGAPSVSKSYLGFGGKQVSIGFFCEEHAPNRVPESEQGQFPRSSRYVGLTIGKIVFALGLVLPCGLFRCWRASDSEVLRDHQRGVFWAFAITSTFFCALGIGIGVLAT